MDQRTVSLTFASRVRSRRAPCLRATVATSAVVSEFSMRNLAEKIISGENGDFRFFGRACDLDE